MCEGVYTYTRRQAIEDGVLVEVDEPRGMTAEAGFFCSVALTRPLFDLVSPTDAERERFGQSYEGRLWDVLHMARIYSRAAREAFGDGSVEVFFPCIFAVCDRETATRRGGRRLTGPRTYRLWFSLAAGDEGEPVVTIGFPEDR